MPQKPPLEKPLTRLQTSSTTSVAAPIGGWNARDSLAQLAATDCVQIDNWIVRTQALQTRLGCSNWATGMPSAPVESLLPYEAPNPANRRLFAAVGSEFYNVTSSGAVGAAVQTALTSARWQHVNFSNSAGHFLVTVNGADSYRYWNGTTWTAVTNFQLQPHNVSFATNVFKTIALYRNRLFLTAVNELAFYFLDAGSVDGHVRIFRMGQVFKRGGRVIALGNWTIDAGDGADDHFVVVSSEGEVAVYVGDDPTSATAWSLIGVYYIGRPVGDRPLAKLSGDLLLITDRGLFPISRALQSASVDRSTALTDKIDEIFRQKTTSLFSVFGWETCLHTNESFLIVNVPDTPKVQYVMDLLTKSWSRFTGWDASCFCYFGDKLFYGTTGKVVQAYVGTSDFGSAIQSVLLTGYNYFGSRGALKQVKLLRPIFATTGAFSFTLGLLGDFRRDIPPVNLSALPSGSALWDTALWDTGIWVSDYSIIKSWRTVFNSPAYNFGISMQLASADVTVQWIAMDYVYTKGGVK